VGHSKKSIYSALAANLLIAITKFIAGFVSSSSAMLSEGVHSVVDTVNELLLLYGIHQSRKPPDALRPFGYGKELYFWSFIVSILIFGLGGGISIYQGVLHILHPQENGDPFWSYIVLACSFIFEGASFLVALKEFNKLRGNEGLWKAIHSSKDPTNFVVLFEDGAAVIGLTIVFLCLWLGDRLHNPYLDGIASVLVGLVLIAVSLVLARESRSLLMGEGIAPATQEKMKALIEKDPAVVTVLNFLSTYQAPETVVLMMIVAFKDGLSTMEINEAIDRISRMIKQEFHLVRYILIQPDLYEGKSDNKAV
jgi:cation diffusion facilitator family transporter